MFIARRNPPKDIRTTSHILLQGDTVRTPKNAPSEPNTTSEAVEETVAQRIRIVPATSMFRLLLKLDNH